MVKKNHIHLVLALVLFYINGHCLGFLGEANQSNELRNAENYSELQNGVLVLGGTGSTSGHIVTEYQNANLFAILIVGRSTLKLLQH